MQQAGIPVIPGRFLDGGTAGKLHEIASEIGYPLMIKADRGEGGKGIRLVTEQTELVEAVAAA